MDAAPLELQTELFGHHKEVRSISVLRSPENGQYMFATGSNDGQLKIWLSLDNGKTYNIFKEDLSHGGSVYAIVALGENRGFATGCVDKHIRLFNMDIVLCASFVAHTAPVGSLAVHPENGYLISGGWDGVVKVWEVALDLSGAHCHNTLAGHENAVCVLGLPNECVATGSAGVRGQGRIDHSKVRIWKGSQTIATITQHDGPVRGLVLHPDGQSFYSCSNDGSIVRYALNGSVLSRYQNPVGYENIPGFIFNVAVDDDGNVAASCDDYCLRLFSGENNDFAVLPHPNFVWDSCFLANGDIVTACADAVVRVFTRDNTRKAPEEVRKDYITRCDSAVQEVMKKQLEKQKLNPNKYPAFEDRMPGSTHGEAKLFRRDGKLWYYTWNATSAIWDCVGECQGVVTDNTIDGVEYDNVIDVEIESQSTGGLQTLKIGINDGDNPYVVAAEFCKKNNISLDQTQAIVDHIQMMRGRTGAQTFSAQGNSVQQSNNQLEKPSSFIPTKFPLGSPVGIVFDKGNCEKILKKIKEFNTKVPADARLTGSEIVEFESLAMTLDDISRYHASSISPNSAMVFQRILKNWDVDHIFPVLDLLRLTLVHPDTLNSYEGYLVDMLKSTMNFVGPKNFENDKLRMAVSLTGSRVLANSFKTRSGSALCVKIASKPETFEVVLAPLANVAEVDNKNVRSTVSAVCLNFANAFCHENKILPDCHFLILSIIVNTLLPIAFKAKEIPTLLNSLSAAGCIYYQKLKESMKLSDEELNWKGEIASYLTESREVFQARDLLLLDELQNLFNQLD